MLSLREVGNFLRSLPVVARLFERQNNSVQTESAIHGEGKGETEDFWACLNDDYYETYPEEWKKDPLYAVGPGFRKILNGVTTIFVRKLRCNEKIVDGAIVRAGRKIWESGRIYRVRADPFVEPSLGEIKLISIELENDSDNARAILTFELRKEEKNDGL